VAESAERLLVRAALARLPERQALLLLLRQMKFSYAECAAIGEVAPGLGRGAIGPRGAGISRGV
jgi:DNA-directed RNA polymerase specialized sigma24 family protein